MGSEAAARPWANHAVCMWALYCDEPVLCFNAEPGIDKYFKFDLTSCEIMHCYVVLVFFGLYFLCYIVRNFYNSTFHNVCVYNDGLRCDVAFKASQSFNLFT